MYIGPEYLGHHSGHRRPPHALERVYRENPRLDFLIMVDDDTYVFPRHLQALLRSLTATPKETMEYVGRTSPAKEESRVIPYGGGGIIFSWLLLHKLWLHWTNSTASAFCCTARSEV